MGSKLIATSVSGESGSIELTLGIYATPDEFLDRARNLRHPFESFAVVPDLDKRKLREALTKGPEWIVATLTKWLQWACELEEQERFLKAKLEPGVSRILGAQTATLLEAHC